MSVMPCNIKVESNIMSAKHEASITCLELFGE